MHIKVEKICTHAVDVACLPCIHQMCEAEEGRLQAASKLLEAKRQLLLMIAEGKLGSPIPIQTFQPNGIGYATTDTEVSRVHAWKFGSSYAIDTYGTLYQSDPYRTQWQVLRPSGTQQLESFALYIQDFLI